MNSGNPMMPGGPMTAGNTQPIQTSGVGTRPTAAMLMRPKKKKKAEPEMKKQEPAGPATAAMLFGKKK